MSSLEHAGRTLATALDAEHEWSWDDRFLMMLLVFESRHSDVVTEALTDALPQAWEGGSDEADRPRAIYHVVSGLGGLRRGQVLRTTDSELDPMLFAAWWPWRDGSRISLRVGIHSARVQGDERNELSRSFRSWFVV
jgi:hypothetical protein